MATPNPALLPDPPLFDVTSIAKKGVEQRWVRQQGRVRCSHAVRFLS